MARAFRRISYASCSTNTSAGVDDIPSWFFRSCSYEIAEAVSFIISRTFATGRVPENWRTAIVTPIPKTSNPKLLSQFRPISVTPILSRLTEKIIVSQYLKPAMSEAKLLQDQYAYRNTGSTTCALIKLLDYITSAFENNRFVHTLYIDFSKAFDIVDHVILIKKLNKLFIPPNIKNWIISFLSNRSQIVKCNGSCSARTCINRGIVQGSALGPFLFCIMVSDLHPLSHYNTLLKYADDITYAIPEKSDQSVINEYDHTKTWAIDNKLVINEQKTGVQCLIRHKKIVKPAGEFGNIHEVNEFRILGVTLDDTLTFSTHISNILNTCYQRFYLLKLLRDQGANTDSLHTIYMSLIVNRISYCLSAWGGFLSQSDIGRIDSMFRKAKRYGYTHTIYDTFGLISKVDRCLFDNIKSNPNHCLYDLLPATKNFLGRERGHSFALPLCKIDCHRKSFMPRCLFSFL